MRSSAVCARNPRHAVRPVMMTAMVSYVLFFCKEIHRALRRIKLPERRHSPSRSEYVVVKALAVATVVPCGMLHHFGIETLHADAAETLLYRQELVERCVDDVVYLSETRFAAGIFTEKRSVPSSGNNPHFNSEKDYTTPALICHFENDTDVVY